VLDASLGKPAASVRVALTRLDASAATYVEIAQGYAHESWQGKSIVEAWLNLGLPIQTGVARRFYQQRAGPKPEFTRLYSKLGSTLRQPTEKHSIPLSRSVGGPTMNGPPSQSITPPGVIQALQTCRAPPYSPLVEPMVVHHLSRELTKSSISMTVSEIYQAQMGDEIKAPAL
jgi:hypothetical protein